MRLHEFNPWWKTSRVPKGLLGKRREIFDKILSFFDYRQIIMLFGMRRAGKTTLMYQLIDYLLEKEKGRSFCILYFSFLLQV